METYWALVANNSVMGVALGGAPVDAGWLSWAEAQWDHVIDVTAFDPRPGIGWTYTDGTFTPPPAPPAPEPDPA